MRRFAFSIVIYSERSNNVENCPILFRKIIKYFKKISLFGHWPDIIYRGVTFVAVAKSEKSHFFEKQKNFLKNFKKMWDGLSFRLLYIIERENYKDIPGIKHTIIGRTLSFEYFRWSALIRFGVRFTKASLCKIVKV